MKQIKQSKWERPSHLPEMVSGLTLPQASCARVTESPFHEIYRKALNQDGHTLDSAGVNMWTRSIKKLLNLWNILRSMVNTLHRLPIARRGLQIHLTTWFVRKGLKSQRNIFTAQKTQFTIKCRILWV